MGETEETVTLLTSFEATDGEWSIQVLARDGRMIVLEDKKDDGVEINYEFLFMAMVDLMNNKDAFEYMNTQNVESMSTFLRERKARLN